MIIERLSAQVDKKTYLVEGLASYDNTKGNDDNVNFSQKSRTFEISPAVGYFIANQFAAGIKLFYSDLKETTLAATSSNKYVRNVKAFAGGPFVRYYFLPSERLLNFLVDASYTYGSQKGKASDPANQVPYSVISKNTIALQAGPVIYFTSSVGLELLVGYSRSKYTDGQSKENRIFGSLGFQISLTKD